MGNILNSIFIVGFGFFGAQYFIQKFDPPMLTVFSPDHMVSTTLKSGRSYKVLVDEEGAISVGEFKKRNSDEPIR